MKEESFTRLAGTYLRMDRTQALSLHPELTIAFTVEDSLRRTLTNAQPPSKTVADALTQTIRASIARQLAKDGTVHLNNALKEAVLYRVAESRIEHILVSGQGELGKAERNRLIAGAERIADSHADLLAAERMEAMTVAWHIAQIDPKGTPNPFRNERLMQIYQRQADRGLISIHPDREL